MTTWLLLTAFYAPYMGAILWGLVRLTRMPHYFAPPAPKVLDGPITLSSDVRGMT